MDLNKLMQMAIEHHHQQEVTKRQFHACFELLAKTFVRSIPPVQRVDQLNISMQDVINDAGYLNDEDEEVFRELMGVAKNMIIEMADKMETPK